MELKIKWKIIRNNSSIIMYTFKCIFKLCIFQKMKKISLVLGISCKFDRRRFKSIQISNYSVTRFKEQELALTRTNHATFPCYAITSQFWQRHVSFQHDRNSILRKSRFYLLQSRWNLFPRTNFKLLNLEFHYEKYILSRKN